MLAGVQGSIGLFAQGRVQVNAPGVVIVERDGRPVGFEQAPTSPITGSGRLWVADTLSLLDAHTHRADRWKHARWRGSSRAAAEAALLRNAG